jgi:two-component system, NtrC family, response regulator GlrR
MIEVKKAATVLVVDDDADLLRLMSLRLQAAGYTVKSARSGEEALGHISTSRPTLVVTDLKMPGMDGMKLFEAIQRDHPALPVIILTAHGTIPDAVSAAQQGVYAFLTKPFDSQDFLKRVADAAAASGVESQTVSAEQNEGWRRAIITRNAAMEEVLRRAKLVAESDVTVMIQGDSGTGKEVLANALHQASRRADKPFLAINCAAIPEQLLESELFGHVKGAFTGANAAHIGLFQAAQGGTIFLDEIGDMPLPLQAKLLRVLQEGQVRPVGSTQQIPIDVRVISATHRNLDQMRKERAFREDLFYRLNVVLLRLPSLFERREDIPLLCAHFLRAIAARYKRPLGQLSPEAMALLVAAPWPGNVRQLENLLEQAVALSTTPMISPALIAQGLEDAKPLVPFDEARRQFEREYLVRLLKLTGGNVAQAAQLANRNRTDFYKLLQRHSLEPAAFKARERESQAA